MSANSPTSLLNLSVVQTESAPPQSEVIALFHQMRAPITRHLLSMRIAPPDAEEITQEVFLALVQHLRQDKSRANLQGWIFKVAHNAALKHRRKTRRYFDRFTSALDISIHAEPGPGPEAALQARQRQHRLLAVVRALPEQDQYCLSLRAEGLRYREIATVLGISLGSVAASLERSLAKLKRSEQL